MAIQTDESRDKTGKRFIFAAMLVAVLMACAVLASCGSDAPTEDSDQEDDGLQGHDPIVLAIDSAAQMAGPLSDLAQTYTEEVPWVTVEVNSVSDPDTFVEEATYASLGDAMVLSDESALKSLKSEKLIGQKSAYTLATDSLAIVAAEDSDIEGVSQRKLRKGTYSLCVAPEKTITGDLVRESLESIGLYKPSKAGDVFAKGLEKDGAVQQADSISNVFERVSSGRCQIAIVLASDVNRFGGVRVVGSVPRDSYSPVRYQVALLASEDPSADDEAASDEEASTAGKSDDSPEDEARVNHSEEAEAFFDWAVSDDDAQRIWKKWKVTLVR